MVTSDFWQNPVGSGPCQFVSEVSGSTLVLSANKDYQLGAPGFDTLTITVMDKANLPTALIAGDLDYYTFGGSISEENRPRGGVGLTVEEGTVPSTFYELMINNETVDSAELRHAIEKALDKELLCQQNTGSLGTVTNTSILPGTEYSRPAGGEHLRPPKGPRNCWPRPGTMGETFTLACTSQRASLAALIQQNLADVGIQVEIETVDSATMFALHERRHLRPGRGQPHPTSLPCGLPAAGSPRTTTSSGARPEPVHHPAHRPGGGDQQDRPHRPGGRVGSPLEPGDALYPPVVLYALHVQFKTVTGIDYAAAACCNENVWQWGDDPGITGARTIIL